MAGTKGAKVPFTIMSTDRCACGAAIKQNVAARVQRRPLSCYGCHTTKERGRRLRPAGGTA
jgi:hypothetical protein